MELLKNIEEEWNLSSESYKVFKELFVVQKFALSSLYSVHLSFSIKNTGFEDWNTKDATKLYLFAMEAIKSNPLLEATEKIDRIISLLRQSCNLQDSIYQAQIACKGVSSLQDGESYILPVEYKQSKHPYGHVALLKFTRLDTENFNIYLYNATKESLHRNGGEFKDTSYRVVPYIKFEKVPWKDIFFAENGHDQPNLKLFERLFNLTEANNMPNGFGGILLCLSHIQERRVSSSENDPLILPQKVENSPIKVLNCFLRDECGSFATYKKLMIVLRFYVIVGVLNSDLKLACPRRKVNLIHEAVKNLMRMMEKAIETKALDPLAGNVQVLQKTITKISKVIDDEMSKMPHETIPQYDPDALRISPENLKNQTKQRAMKIEELKKKLQSKIPDQVEPVKDFDIYPILETTVTWENLEIICEDQITMMTSILEIKMSYEEATFKIHSTFRSLADLKFELPKKPLSLQKSLLALYNLLEVHRLYNEILFKIKDFNLPEVHITSMEMLLLTYRLAVMADRRISTKSRKIFHKHHYLPCEEGEEGFNILSNYSVNYSLLQNALKSTRLYLIMDYPLNEQFNKMLQYMEKEQKSKIIFDFGLGLGTKQEYQDGFTTESQMFREYFGEQEKSLVDSSQFYDTFINTFGGDTLPHVYYLKMISLLAHEAFSIGNIKETSKYFSIDSHYQQGFSLVTENSTWSTSSSSKHNPARFVTNGQEYTDKLVSLKEYLQNNQSVHDPKAHLSENHILTLNRIEDRKPNDDKDAELYLAFAAQSQWDVQESALQTIIEMKPDILKLQSDRKVLFYSLAKIIFIHNEVKVALLRMLEMDVENILNRLENLVKLCFARFVDGVKRDFDQFFITYLFSSRLYIWAHFVCENNGVLQKKIKNNPDRQRAIKEFLKHLDDFKYPITRKLQIEANIAKLGLLLVLARQEDDKNHGTRIMVLNLYLRSNLFKSNLLEDESLWRTCQEKIYRHNWDSYSVEDCEKLGREVLKAYDVDPNGVWRYDPQTTIIELEGKVKIHLRRSLVYDAKRNVLSGTLEFEETSTWKRLFKQRRHDYDLTGQAITFTDQLWGKMQVKARGKRIFRIIEDKPWLIIDLELTEDLVLNLSFKYDHIFFFNFDTGVIRGYNMHNQKHEVTIEKGKFVFDIESSHNLKGWICYFDSNRITKSLPCFENTNLVFFAINQENQENQSNLPSQAIVFSRLKTVENRSVSFLLKKINEKNEWVCSFNRDYALTHNFHINLDLFISHALALRHLHPANPRGSTHRLLIPRGKIRGGEAYEKIAEIYLEEPQGDGQQGSIPSIPCYECDLFLNSEKPVQNIYFESLEARLYFINLRLAQKGYQDCLIYIKKIPLNEQLNDNMIVTTQFLFGREKGKDNKIHSQWLLRDFHANGLAIRLQLILILLRIDKRVTKWPSKDFLTWYDKYLAGINDVDFDLRLTQKQEHALICFIKRSTQIDESELRFRNRECIITSQKGFRRVYSTPTVEYNHYNFEDCAPNESSISTSTLTKNLKNNKKAEYEIFTRFWDRAGKPSQVSDLLYTILTLFGKEAITETMIQFTAILILFVNAKEAIEKAMAKVAEERRKRQENELNDERRANNYAINREKQRCDYHNWRYRGPEPNNKYIDVPPINIPKDSFPWKLDYDEWVTYVSEVKLMSGHKSSVSIKDWLNQFKDFTSPNPKVDDFDDLAFLKHGQKERPKENSPEYHCQLDDDDMDLLILDLSSGADFFKQKIPQILELSLNKQKYKPRFESRCIGYNSQGNDFHKIVRKACRRSHNLFLQKSFLINDKFLKSIYQHTTLYMLLNSLKQDVNISGLKCYDWKVHRKILDFEYYSKMELREEQWDIIKKYLGLNLKERFGYLFQLLMGGGKTCVILSLLLELTAEKYPERLNFVLSLPSQMPMIKGAMSRFQKERFGKDVYILEYTMKDLNDIENLIWIKSRFENARKRRCAVIMQRSLAQFIELKYIMELFQKSNETEKIKTLRDVLLMMRDIGVGFYDECDQNLSLTYYVLVPLGTPQEPNVHFGAVISEMFRILIQDESCLSLMKNEPTPDAIKTKLWTVLLEKIVDYKPLRLEPDQHEVFRRYITNQFSSENQICADEEINPLDELNQENVLFLREMNELAKDKTTEPIANYRALVRHLMVSILPSVLSKAYNRGYGKNPERPGEVVPYRAAQTPDTTKFGDCLTSFSYNCLAAILGKIEKDEFMIGAERIYTSAFNFSRELQEEINQTLEGKLFKELTSIEVTEINDPACIDRALNHINSTPLTRLAYAKEFFTFYIDYYPERLMSNSINVVDQFNSSVACSGTLWNKETFHPNIEKSSQLATDVEERILNEMENHYSKKELRIQEISNRHLKPIVDLIINQIKDSQRVFGGLIDCAGYLKDESIRQSAVTILQEIAKITPQITSLVYLHQANESELKRGWPSESFAYIKTIDYIPVLLKNTTPEEFERHNLKKENIFILFDEKISFGSDIPANPKGTFLLTVDHCTQINRLLQASLRARGFFQDQRIEIVITESSRKIIKDSNVELNDLLNQFKANEKKALKHMEQLSYQTKIEAIIRNTSMKILFELSENGSVQRPDAIQALKPFLVQQLKEDLYNQFGKIKAARSPFDKIQDFANEKLKEFEVVVKKYQFKQEHFDITKSEVEDFLPKCKDRIQKVEEEEKLNEQVDEIEIQVERVIEIKNYIKIELQDEVLNQLQLQMNIVKTHSQYSKEQLWNLNPDIDLWKQIKPSCQLKTAFFDISSTNFPISTTFPFSTIFPENFHITKNFASVLTVPTQCFQFDKRIYHLLALNSKDSGLHFIGLSLFDADYFKSFLQDNIGKKLQACLVDVRGISATGIQDDDLLNRKETKIAIWFANFFNTDISFLDNSELSKEIVSGQNEENKEKKHDQQNDRNEKFEHDKLNEQNEDDDEQDQKAEQEKKNLLMSRFLLSKIIRFQRDLMKKLYYSKYFKIPPSLLSEATTSGIIFSSRREDMMKRI